MSDPRDSASELGQYIARQERTQSWSPIPDIVKAALMPRVASDPAPEEDDEQDEGKIEDYDLYVLRWQIWDKDDRDWIPYNPSKAPAPIYRPFPNSYFVVNIRYDNPHAKPKYVISNWSERLLNFMRATIGNDFFKDDPEYDVDDLFYEIRSLRGKHARAKELLISRSYVDMASKVKEVAEMGFMEANKPTVTWGMCKTYLSELIEHLEVFMDYFNEKFAPIEQKLARLRDFDQMEFDYLIYYYEPGQKLVTFDANGRPEAFVLTSRKIQTQWGTREISLIGYAYWYNGDEFLKKTITAGTNEYKGTRPSSGLPAILLTDDMEAKLKARGQLYTSLCGVQHKEYKGQRVILDPKAFSNREGYTRDPQAIIELLADDLLYLLPPDMEGFNLANKICRECQRLKQYCAGGTCQVWQRYDITKIKDVAFDEQAWDHLVLERDTKLLIEALVRVTTTTNTAENIITDVISGKGGGLISVLHGPPGTGKTLTAESIAEHLHRPLYMVGFAELSTTASTMETSLRKILSLATAWDAILLIDEADVFLEQRSLQELDRNALVSVALRLLEYHRGVLFLTTNRITTFDEAFLSRFSIAIKYNELNRDGRHAVWRKFFELAGCRIESADLEEGFTKVGGFVSNEDLDELAGKPFNGRTIKNLVRTAQALSLSQGKALSAEHVKTVVRVQEKFLQEFASASAD